MYRTACNGFTFGCAHQTRAAAQEQIDIAQGEAKAKGLMVTGYEVLGPQDLLASKAHQEAVADHWDSFIGRTLLRWL